MAVASAIHRSVRIGACRLKNRLAALPVFTGYAYPDGTVSPLMIAHYKTLAASGVAMVVVANAAVSADGVTSKYNLRIDDDRFVPGLNALAAAIRQQGALACIQLNHAGRFAKTPHPLLASPPDTSNIAYNLAAVKDFMHSFPFERRFGLTGFFLKQIAAWHRAMTDEELDAMIAQFYNAAVRACEAGFDMIELHGANGYLLCEFLSPATNKRRSDFGGSLENRMALPRTIIREIRHRLPSHVPLGFRLLLNEWVPGGITLPESIAIAKRLEKTGIDYLSAAAGTFNSIFRPQVVVKMKGLAYLRDDMAALTRQVTIPTIISGRVATPALANDLLEQQVTDLIGLGRPLRADPHWVDKARNPARTIRTCVNCNWCLKRVILDQGFNCQRWPNTIRLRTDLDHMLLTRNFKGLWVVADEQDLAQFKAALPEILPAGQWMQPPFAPTALFLQTKTGAGWSDTDRSGLVSWAGQLAAAGGRSHESLTTVAAPVHGTHDQTIGNEAEHSQSGLILIGRNRKELWRQRLLYTQSSKVVGLISPNPRLRDVAVLLDFSNSSLLILTYLRYAYHDLPDYRLRFIHACTGSIRQARWQWEKLKKVVDLDTDAPLKLIASHGNVAAAVIDEITAGPYGTIVMGKRGLSRIKRLLLGSISRAVLRYTEDQSLILVD